MKRPAILSTRPAGVLGITSTTAPDPDPDQRSSLEPVHDGGGLADLRAYLRESRDHLDKMARAINAGQPGVLETATITIPAAGYVERSYRIPYAAVMAANLGLLGPVTIASAGAQNSPPGGGQGQIQVPVSSWLGQNLAGQAITFYGQPGTVVTYSTLVRPIPPGAGPLNSGAQQLWTNVAANGVGQNISASGAGPVLSTAGCRNLGLMVAVTAAPTGTAPTLTVSIAGFDFPGGNPYAIGATAALNAVGDTAVASGPGTGNAFIVPALVQVTWTIGGTGGPDFPNVDITLIGRS